MQHFLVAVLVACILGYLVGRLRRAMRPPSSGSCGSCAGCGQSTCAPPEADPDQAPRQ